MLPPMPMVPWTAIKKLYHTHSVTVTPAAVRVPTQRPLVPSFTLARPATFHLALVSIECIIKANKNWKNDCAGHIERLNGEKIVKES